MNCLTDGKKVAYFRGRKLHGRHVKIPDGYRGVVLKSIDRSVPQGSDNTGVAQPECNALAEQDEGAEDEPVKILEEQASFDAVVLWGHESTPDANDPYVKGIEEWIALAETMHSTSPSTVDAVQDRRNP